MYFILVKLWGSISNQTAKPLELLGQSLSNRVTVIRTQRPVDKAFIYTVAILVSIAFINMGCTLDLGIVKETLKKPIGPAIGFCCQYIFMPLVILYQLKYTNVCAKLLNIYNFFSVLLVWRVCCCPKVVLFSLVFLLLDAAQVEERPICGRSY